MHHIKIIVLTVLVGMAGGLSVHAAQAVSGQLNIATAQADEFALLPGIGPKKAEAIVAHRAEHPFQKVEDLIEVKGIGPKMFEKIKAYLTIEGESTLKAAPAQAKPGLEGASAALDRIHKA